jgi:hypothetical protein
VPNRAPLPNLGVRGLLAGAVDRSCWTDSCRGRLCVVRKSQAAIAKARVKAIRGAQKSRRKVQATTLLYAE